MIRFYRNFIFSFFGAIYFLLYYSPDYILLYNYLELRFEYTDILISYLSAIIAFIFTIWIIWLINRSSEFVLNKVFKENSTALFIIDFIVSLVSISKYFAAFYAFSIFAILSESIKSLSNTIYSVTIILVFLIYITWFINNFFSHDLIQKSKLKALSRNLLPIINKVIIAFIWIIWVITIFDNLWYDISALIAWAWIWGLAIAFAAQKSISNVFWAVTILLNKPFKIWDFVTVNWVNWTVKDIGLSYLTLIDRLWHQVMIPNESIISTNVENFSVRKNRRTDFWIWLVYWTTIERMKKWVEIIEEILEEYKIEETISSYRVNFDMFWDFSLNIQVTYFSLINDSFIDYLKQKEDINLEIKKRFKIARLDMAFPTQELILKKED